MTMRMAHGSANERPEQTTALTESDSVEVAELSAPAQQLLSAAVLLTAVGVFVVDNLLRPSREVLLDSLPIAAVCLGVLGFLCAAARLLGSIEWGIVACFGLLLGAVFGPHAISAPVAAVLLVLGLADTLRRLRLPRRELMRATGMAATATATIVLTLNPYTSFDMIARLHAGSVRLDTLYHASIGAMIKNYGVVSTGLNGLVPTPYHALSHALYAAISLLSTQPVIEAYGVASWLLFAPLLIFSATACSVMLCGRRPIDAAAAWIAACVLLTLAPAAFGRWGLWKPYFTSESYLVSLTLLLLTLPLLYRRAPQHKDYLLLVILTSAAAAAKASVGFMIIGLYALRSLLLRNGGARRPDALVLLAMAVATALVAYDSVVTNSDVVSLGPVHFIAHYSYLGKYLTAVHDALRIAGSIPLRTWALAMIAVASFVVFHFAVSWTVIADAVRQQGPAALLDDPQCRVLARGRGRRPRHRVHLPDHGRFGLLLHEHRLLRVAARPAAAGRGELRDERRGRAHRAARGRPCAVPVRDAGEVGGGGRRVPARGTQRADRAAAAGAPRSAAAMGTGGGCGERRGQSGQRVLRAPVRVPGRFGAFLGVAGAAACDLPLHRLRLRELSHRRRCERPLGPGTPAAPRPHRALVGARRRRRRP